jgi:hypothetical protein
VESQSFAFPQLIVLLILFSPSPIPLVIYVFTDSEETKKECMLFVEISFECLIDSLAYQSSNLLAVAHSL